MRRAVFRTLWLLIGLVVAISLFKLAFTGSKVDAEESPLTPTGKAPAEEVVAEKGTISNTLKVDGTIVIDKPVAVTAPASGVLAHKYADTGAKVEKGDRLFQVRVEEESVTGPETEAEPEPKTEDPAERGEQAAQGPEPAPPAKPTYRWFTVVAPASGTVGTYATGLMEETAEDAVVVSVKRETFHAVGAITPLDRYRLASDPDKATVEIKGGPKPFTCTHLTVGEAATETVESGSEPEGGEMGMPEGEGGGESEAGSRISCVVPRKVTVYDGLTMTMSIDAGKSDGKVVVIPVTSVKGLFGEGTVWLLGEDGTPTEHPVTLGETDGKQVEVTSGLKSGDRVLRYVPGSAPEPEGGEEMMYG